jgi:hypothetical protein
VRITRTQQPTQRKETMQTPVCEAFSLDHPKFREHLERVYGEPADLDALPEDGGLPVALAQRLKDARDCDAIRGPQNTVVYAYPLADSLLISVREREDPPDVPLRQIAAHAFDINHIARRRDESFAACCSAIEEVLAHATELLPLLRALQTGERQADPAQYELPKVSAYHATGGTVVVEIDTEPVGPARHDAAAPYLRVYVDEIRVFEYPPPTLVAGSREARTHSDPDPDAPVGRLVVDAPASQGGGER